MLPSPTPPEKLAQMIKDYKGGLSTVGLAKKYSVNKGTVFLLIKKAGIIRSRSEGKLFATNGWRIMRFDDRSKLPFGSFWLTEKMMATLRLRRNPHSVIWWKVTTTKQGVHIVFRQEKFVKESLG